MRLVTLPTSTQQQIVNARRIIVLGPSGGGKSTVARALGMQLGLPVTHFDLHCWNAGWVMSPRATRIKLIEHFAAGDEWIIDGNSSAALALRLDRADVAVWVPCPSVTCLWRVLRRTWRHRGRALADTPADCIQRFDRAYGRFLWYIAFEQRRAMQQLRETVVASGTTVVDLPSSALVETHV
ncbi:MAG: topology modulation protein [Thermoleophilia bacterium]|nr:topology modulation protein [Thermoleophilia bacterium]